MPEECKAGAAAHDAIQYLQPTDVPFRPRVAQGHHHRAPNRRPVLRQAGRKGLRGRDTTVPCLQETSVEFADRTSRSVVARPPARTGIVNGCARPAFHSRPASARRRSAPPQTWSSSRLRSSRSESHETANSHAGRTEAAGGIRPTSSVVRAGRHRSTDRRVTRRVLGGAGCLAGVPRLTILQHPLVLLRDEIVRNVVLPPSDGITR